MVDFHKKRIVRSHESALVKKRLDGSFPCEEWTAICVSSTTEEVIEARGRHPPPKGRTISSLAMKILFFVGSAIKSFIAIVIDTILRKLFTFCRQPDFTIRLYKGCRMTGSEPNIRTLKHLSYRLGVPEHDLLCISESAQNRYSRYKKKKKNGKIRVIEPPDAELKSIQKKISILLSELDLPDNIHSYRKGRSIKTNAMPHVGNDYLLKSDIRDFYPHITNKMVYGFFKSLGCAPDVCRILTRLITKDGHLPQGAPTSPTIANHIIARIAWRINRLENEYNLTATYYGDDISISGNRRVKKFKNLVRKIISQEGLKVAEEKFAILGPDEEKAVAGVSVGEKNTFVPKKYYGDLVAQIKNSPRHVNSDSSINSKIAYVNWLNPKQGKKLRDIQHKSS